MVTIPRRAEKIAILKWKQKGLCACGCKKRLPMYGSYGESLDLHHIMNDTKGNRARYPLMIHSAMNLQAVMHGCHISGGKGKLRHFTDFQAERIEKALRDNPSIAEKVNCRAASIRS